MRLAVALVLMCCVASTLGAGEGRDQQVLAWDDGGPVIPLYPFPLDDIGAAVMFQAPEGYTWLHSIQCYVCSDQAVDPEDPSTPTTGPCILSVWRPAEGGNQPPPVGDPVYAYGSGEQYPEEAWVEFAPPQELDLSDPTVFPERRFFVGIRWLADWDPVLGFDADPLEFGYTWLALPSEWSQTTDRTAMIRAVVSDANGTPVELRSWGRIKAAHE
jgi:hypothetical protein